MYKPAVLNVGGNSKTTVMPAHYQHWRQCFLDIDPRWNPDILCDARSLTTQAPGQFDAIYCSHNLEHYYAHDVAKVLTGFLHVLQPDGFAEVIVPDMRAVMKTMLDRNLDIDDPLYISPAGPISTRDVIYGFGAEIERSGNDFFAHKTGFTPQSLQRALNISGFPIVFLAPGHMEVRALAFRTTPVARQQQLFGLPPLPPQA
jgi:SAM-dependent methyltransferase